MAYLDAYIDVGPTWGWQGGPGFSTRVTQLANGRERRQAQWARVRHSYTLPFGNIEKDDYRAIKRMHLVCRGQLHAFRFRDELDYEAQDEQFAVADGDATTYQLAKLSEVDGLAYEREVFAIVSAAITVNGVAATPTVDLRRGTVAFAAPPAEGAVLRWTGLHDVWVRFAQDDLPFTLDDLDARNGSIDLIEVPPPEAGDD